MSLVLHLPLKIQRCLPWFLEMPQKPHVLRTFDKVHNPLRLPRETTSAPPKLVRTLGGLGILTSKCASRHNGVHFFDISTFNGGPNMVCFVRFDFELCFARNLFISHLAGWLRTRRFSEHTFRTFGATDHWKKHNASRLSYLLAHLHLLSSDFFSSLIFSLLVSPFYSSAPPLLFICPYCRKFDF